MIEALEFTGLEQLVLGTTEQELLEVASLEQLTLETTEQELLELAAQGPPGPPGGTGVDGAAGPAGPQGTGLVLLGALATPGDLPVAAQPGDAYLIAGDLWVFDGTAWTNGGPVQGPTGEKGKDGQIRFTGHGAPPTVIVGASPGDTYMDLDTGDIYKLQ